MAYEGPHGALADYAKAVHIVSSYDEGFAAKRRKGAQDTTMFSLTSPRRGSMGDAPVRVQGGGDARPRSTREPCVYFLKGKCSRGTRCRFRNIQTPNRNGDRRVFTFNNPSNRYWGQQPGSRRKGSKATRERQTCFTCGRPGHFKKDCRVINKDSTNVAFDFALATVDLQEHELVSCQTPATQTTDNDTANMAVSQPSDLASCWLVDGGASCHVAGFDPGDALRNRTRATIEILVGGGRRIKPYNSFKTYVKGRTSCTGIQIKPTFGSPHGEGGMVPIARWWTVQSDGQ